MIRVLYIVRHCSAVGQQPTAPLDPKGRMQAQHLADALTGCGIERIVSSPWTRAYESIAPLANKLAQPIETDERLIEALLTTHALSNWRQCLAATFEDDELQFAGGESSDAATRRVVEATDGILHHNARTSAVVSHGRLITLLLRHFDVRFGFETWTRLTYPDVFCLVITNRGVHIERVWSETQASIHPMALPLYV